MPRKAQNPIKVLKHIELWNAEKQQLIRDLAEKHRAERQELEAQHTAEYTAVLHEFQHQRSLEVVESLASYVAAGKPIPQEVYHEAGQSAHAPQFTGGCQNCGTVPAAPAAPHYRY